MPLLDYLVGIKVLPQICSLAGVEELLRMTSCVCHCLFGESDFINIKPICCEFPHMDHVSHIPSVCHAWEFQLLKPFWIAYVFQLWHQLCHSPLIFLNGMLVSLELGTPDSHAILQDGPNLSLVE